MKTQLLTLLSREKELLARLVALTEQQQKALIKFNSVDIEQVTKQQEQVSIKLHEAETQRISLLMNAFKIGRKEASSLRLSTLRRFFDENELEKIDTLRIELRTLISGLHSTNLLNRVLANRARGTVKEMLSIFTNGSNHVCNVQV